MTEFMPDGPAPEEPATSAAELYASQPGGTMQALKNVATSSNLGLGFEQMAEQGTQKGSSGWNQFATGFLKSALESHPGAFGVAYTGAEQAASGIPNPGSVETPMLSPEDANKQYAPPGEKITDHPMSEGEAQIVGKARYDQIDREAALQRYYGAHSWPVNAAVVMAGGLADPFNVAAMFVPPIGEEALAAKLGEGFLARTATRALSGAVTGAVSQLPLTALRYGEAQQTGQDYSVRAAFNDIAMGAGQYAAMAAGFGAVGDVLGWGVNRAFGRKPGTPPPPGSDIDPITNHTAISGAVANIVEGKPVDVDGIFQAKRLQEENIEGLRARAEYHRGQANAMLDERDQVGATDPDTAARIAAVENELAKPEGMTAERRAALEDEHRMLTEGAQPRSELDLARDEAQRTALEVAAHNHMQSLDEVRERMTAQLKALHEDGYSPGMTREEFAAAYKAVYEPPPEGAEVKPAAAPAAPVKPLAEQHAAIAADIERQLLAAGRPADEAHASAVIAANGYLNRAAASPHLGTPEELYAREGAEVRGEGQPPPTGEGVTFNQLPGGESRDDERISTRTPTARGMEDLGHQSSDLTIGLESS